MTELETIRRTRIANREVVTLRLENPHLYHPYQTFMVIDGVRSHTAHHHSEAAALHHHATLASAERKQHGRGR